MPSMDVWTHTTGPVQAHQFISRHFTHDGPSLNSVPALLDNVSESKIMSDLRSGIIRNLNSACKETPLSFSPFDDGDDRGANAIAGIVDDDNHNCGGDCTLLRNTSLFVLCNPEDSTIDLNDKTPSCLQDMEDFATRVLQTQYRTHTYGVYATLAFVRLFRFDASGVTFTKPMRYSLPHESRLVTYFFWQFASSARDVQGFDTSVEVVRDRKEVSTARRALQKWALDMKIAFPIDEGRERDFVVMSIPGSQERVVAWNPLHSPNSTRDKCTKIFPVYTRAGTIMCVKDSWRREGLLKETSVLEKLNQCNVPNIPTVLAGGDIEMPGHSVFAQTWTGIPRSSRKTWQHHRYLMKEIAWPLDICSSSHQLLCVLRDAVDAHRVAWNIGLMHNDIQPDHALVTEDGRGLLIGWGNSQIVYRSNSNQLPRRVASSLNFSSLHGLLRDCHLTDRAIDDLESFIWVLVYMALRFFESSRLYILPELLDATFSPTDKDLVLGNKKSLMFNFRHDAESIGFAFRNTLLDFCLRDTFDLVERWNEVQWNAFSDHGSLLTLWNTYIERVGWPEDCLLDFLEDDVRQAALDLQEDERREAASACNENDLTNR